jgi:hypothetical protein
MEHLGWQCFRQAALDGASPEIFSDNESKIQKYERLLVVLRLCGSGIPAVNPRVEYQHEW